MSDNIPKFNVKKRQARAFEATIENVKIANDTIKSSQNWLWSLSIAELSFLGVIIFNSREINTCVIWLLKLLIVFLLLSFIFFIFASVLQYRYLLKTARFYEKLSNKANEYLTNGDFVLEKEPEKLKFPKQQIVTGKLVNYLFFASYIMTILATIGIIVFIILE